tara:strand:- start:43 stop:3756 length:3714 start_codon:yes stop_codon:yes gene_type:complete
MAKLNEYSPSLFEPTIAPEQSTFGETVEATIGLRFMPFIDNALTGARFANVERDPDYDWEADLGDYTEYASDLYQSKNAEEMAARKATIDRSIERRRVLSESTFLTQLGAGLFDPINFIALPLGGPSVGVLRSAIRVGVGSAIVEGTAQAVNLQLDAVKTVEEATIETAGTAIFGAALGSLVSIPVTRQAAARDATNAADLELMGMANRIGNLQGLTPEQIRNPTPRADRPLAEVDDVELQSRIDSFEAEAVEADSIGATQIASDLRTEARSFRNEAGIRELEDMDVDLEDPFNIASSWFTNSVFYRAVSTPMKRTLQGDYPSAVKEIFLRSFGDNGILTSLASIGLPSPQSVAIRSAVRQGQWVRANDELTKIWASETNASPSSRLDINLSDVARTVTRSDNTFRSWLTSVNERRILGDKNVSDAELRASSIITKYFEEGGGRLENRGLLGTARGMTRQVEMLEVELTNLRSSLTGVRLKSPERDMVEGRIRTLEARVESANRMRDRPDGPEPREPFNPRFFDKPAIRRDRDGFFRVLYKWFEENPFIYRLDEAGNPTKVELSVMPEDITARVNQTIDGILGEKDPADLDNLSFGAGRSTHFKARQLDIPNSLAVDFMITDPIAVMKAYASRVEPRFEFSDMFGKNLDSVLFDIERSMVSAGKSQAEINAVMKDYKHMYGRTIGSVLENPDALSIRAGNFLRQAATYSYLGGAGLAAIPDFGRIIMEYDLDSVWKGVQGLADRTRVDMLANEVRMAGEGLDIIKGSAHMRFTEDLTNNIDSDIFNKIQSAFHIFNGLGPLTTIAKQLAGIVDGHQIIDYSIKLSRGELGPQDTIWLLKHGIGEDMARQIARAPYERSENGLYYPNTDAWTDSISIPEINNNQLKLVESNPDGSPVGRMRGNRYVPASYNQTNRTISFDRDYIEGTMFEARAWLDPKVEGVNALPDIFNTPRQWSNFVMLHEVNHSRFSKEDLGFSKDQTVEYENAINDLALKDYREAQTISEETVMQFRAALNSGVLNTIMSGTPADKPIITDGVVHIPMSVASKFGMKEHPNFTGYARIENGFLGFPFQFYSFVLANINKTVGSLAQGTVKNRAIGATTMLGLGYMVLQHRTPDYIWDEMSPQDKFARTFDMSGIAALYSDLFYLSMHTSLALGGPNISNGFLSPKFNQQQNLTDAITGIAGAGPSWTVDTARGVVDFASGNYGEGGKDIVRNLPFARMWFWKDEMNQITNAIAN